MKGEGRREMDPHVWIFEATGIVSPVLLSFKKYKMLFHFISPDLNTWEVERTIK